MPQLRANYSALLGTLTRTNEDGVPETVLPAEVLVSTVQEGEGHPKVLYLKSAATHFNEIISIQLTTAPEGSAQASEMESFLIDITDPVTGQTYLMGPIFRDTVAMIADEQAGPYPPHAQVAGTRKGESIQSLFHAVPFFRSFADEVAVTKMSVNVASKDTISWKVTFFNANYSSWSYDVIPAALNSGSSASVSVVQAPNPIGGTFQMSYGGYLTSDLPYNATSEELTDALMGLYSVYDPELNIGSVIAARRGPDLEGAYRWYIAILQDIDFADALAPQEVVTTGLTGEGVYMSLWQLRGAFEGYGFRLHRDLSGVANGLASNYGGNAPNLVASFFDWQPSLVLVGTPPMVTAALNGIQYKPTANWNGDVKVIVRVSDRPDVKSGGVSVVSEQVSAVLPVSVLAVNDAPVIKWRGSALGAEDFTVLRISEDADVRLGDEVLYVTADDQLDNIIYSPAGQLPAGVNVEDTLLSGAQELTEPHRAVVRFGLQVEDLDINGGVMQVSLQVRSGFLSVDGIATLRGAVTPTILEVTRLHVNSTITTGNRIAAGETLILTGDIFAINNQLQTLKYQSPLNANGYDYIDISVSDAGYTGGDGSVDIEDISTADGYELNHTMVTTATLTIDLEPLNDAPVLSISGTTVGTLYQNQSSWPIGIAHGLEDETIHIGSYFSIYDPDFDVSNFIGDNFGGISGRNYIRDGSIVMDEFFVSLEVMFGVVKLPSVGSVTFLDSAADLEVILTTGQFHHDLSPFHRPVDARGGERSLFLLGSYFEIRELLMQAEYTPDADWFGVDTLTISINDLGNIGAGGAFNLTRQILLDVEAVEDSPVLSLPNQQGMLRTVEDTVGVIGVDCCDWVAEDSAAFDNAIRNISLASIQISDKDVYQHERAARVIVRTTEKFVNPTNNDPLFNVTYTTPDIQDVNVYSYDWNDHIAVDPTFTVALNASHGVMTIPRLPHTVQLLHGAGFQDDSIVIRGNLTEINIALRSLNYIPDLNWNSELEPSFAAAHGIDSVETLHVEVTDASGLTDYGKLTIFVQAANDPPVLSIGALTQHDVVDYEVDQLSRTVLKVNTLQCIENEACPIEELVVRDVDVMDSVDGALRFTFAAANGTFAVDPIVSSVGKFFRSSQSYVQITVPASELFTALNGIVYHPDLDYYGFDEILVSVDDLGNTGYGPLCVEFEAAGKPCSMTDSLRIPVYISPQPDRIEIVTPTDLITGAEDGLIVVQNLWFINHQHLALDSISAAQSIIGAGDHTFEEPGALLFNISNPDDKVFHVRVTTAQGRLTLQDIPSGLVFTIGDGSLNSELEFHGPLGLINTALADLQFLPKPNLNILNAGICTIHVEITDTINAPQDRTNIPQVVSAMADLEVRVLAVDDGPVVHVPGETYAVDRSVPARVSRVVRVNTVQLDEEEPYVLDEIYVTDVDVAEYKFASVTVDLSCEHGVFMSSNYTVRQFIQPVSDTTSAVGSTRLETAGPTGLVSYNDRYGLRTIPAVFHHVRLQGRLEHVNSMLRSVEYIPDKDYFGSDTITASACAVCLRRTAPLSPEDAVLFELTERYLNISHTDCPACHSESIPISIRSVNDAPEWLVPRIPVFVQEDISFQFSADSIEIIDVDSADNNLLVELSTEIGAITLPSIPFGVTVLNGTGENDQLVIMTGTLADLNHVVSRLMYVPPRNWHSEKSGIPGTIHFLVNDLGHVEDAFETIFNTTYQVISSDTLGLVAEAEVVIVVREGIQHTPYVLVPGAEIVELPCESQDGQLAEIQEIRVYPRQEQCQRIISVAIFDITEDTPTHIPNVTVGDADEAFRSFGLNHYQLNLSTVQGLVSLANPEAFWGESN